MTSENPHVVPVPNFFFSLRVIQVILSIVVFILACYGLSFVSSCRSHQLAPLPDKSNRTPGFSAATATRSS